MTSRRPRWRSRVWLIALAILAATCLVPLTFGVERPGAVWLTISLSLFFVGAAIAWALVQSRAQRRVFEDELAGWAAEQATQAERIRIARDLHDLVSHGLGLITVRAAVARTMTGPSGLAEQEAALADIEHASRQTTTELRRMLHVLRSTEAAQLRPADSLEDLPEIVAAAQRAGLTVSLEIAEIGEVTAGAQLTACAVIREALNNTLRHAGPTRASVEIRRSADMLVVAVHDQGRVPGWEPQPGARHGLEGVRERVAALDGTVMSGATSEGWLLTARVPDRMPA
ncbi:sensor histidine kinase [Leucobacter luti]|uniref:sensor histidine kinase n=1 Tax=Leucobacter luti TaxID=340320 RepID=UPI00104D7448|nr:histidine kinase [Leucobacter luti]MCW2288190.1 signal transduction histidine kinase [Leucobacter luti]